MCFEVIRLAVPGENDLGFSKTVLGLIMEHSDFHIISLLDGIRSELSP